MLIPPRNFTTNHIKHPGNRTSIPLILITTIALLLMLAGPTANQFPSSLSLYCANSRRTMLANRGHPEPPTTSPPTIIIPSSSSNISPVANRISQSSDFNDDQDEDCLLQNANQSGRKRCCPFVPSSISAAAGRPGRWSNFSQQLRAQET